MGGVTLIGTWGCQVQVKSRAGSARESSRVTPGNASLGAGSGGILLPSGLGLLHSYQSDAVFLLQINILNGVGAIFRVSGHIWKLASAEAMMEEGE